MDDDEGPFGGGEEVDWFEHELDCLARTGVPPPLREDSVRATPIWEPANQTRGAKAPKAPKGELPTAEALCVEPLALSPLSHVMDRLMEMAAAAEGGAGGEEAEGSGATGGMLDEDEDEGGGGAGRGGVAQPAPKMIRAALGSAVTFATNCRTRHGWDIAKCAQREVDDARELSAAEHAHHHIRHVQTYGYLGGVD